MSRTYRTHIEYKVHAHGMVMTWEESHDLQEQIIAEMGLTKKEWFWYSFGWAPCYTIDRRCRDRKPWDKPNHEYKKMNRRIERAQEHQAVRTGKECPLFKKTDQWNWT